MRPANEIVCHAIHTLTRNTELTETILITGSNRGIGLELAHQYAVQGWQVLVIAKIMMHRTAVLRTALTSELLK